MEVRGDVYEEQNNLPTYDMHCMPRRANKNELGDRM